MASHQVLTVDDCLQVARRYFGCDDVKVSKWQERKLSKKPAGYLGEHKLAEVYASSGTREACIPIFIKTIPDNEKQAALIAKTGAFRKEILFYQKLVSEWENRGIIPKDSVANRKLSDEEVSWNCKLYVARDEVVILENISLLDYTSDNPRNPYDYNHAVMALKMLAGFHGQCFAYEEQMSSELGRPFRVGEEFPEMVQDTFYLIKEGHPGEHITESGVYALLECAKLLPICDNLEVRKLVEERLPGTLRWMFESVKASKRFRNVLCHADLWQNNILFRYAPDEAGIVKKKNNYLNGQSEMLRRPLDVKLVDFQLLRYAPPAHDVFDLLYLTTRRALRDDFGDELLWEYYDALAAAMRRRGVDPERVLPWEDFQASLEEQRFAGRLSAVHALHFLLSSEEVIGDVFGDETQYDFTVNTGKGRASLVCPQFLNDVVYRERLEECLMELLEKHVLI